MAGPHFSHLTRRMQTMYTILRTSIIALLIAGMAAADESLFSGPQVGEELTPFDAQAAFGHSKKESVLEGTSDSPILIIFVHQVTRPSIGLTRLLMEFAATKEQDGLKSRLIFLTDDVTETTAFLNRARHALPPGVMPLISTEGIEGPGAYGLNRKMALTVLIGSKGVVTANFPLVQPSIQTDAPKIGHEIVEVLGRSDAPTLREMGYREPRMAMRQGGQQPERDAIYRQMMAPVIQKNATAEDVMAAAAEVEEFAAENPWFRQRVYDASRRISESPRLKDYGTTEAQECLKKWAKEFAPKEDEPVDEVGPVQARAVEESASGANDPGKSRSEDSAVQDE